MVERLSYDQIRCLSLKDGLVSLQTFRFPSFIGLTGNLESSSATFEPPTLSVMSEENGRHTNMSSAAVMCRNGKHVQNLPLVIEQLGFVASVVTPDVPLRNRLDWTFSAPLKWGWVRAEWRDESYEGGGQDKEAYEWDDPAVLLKGQTCGSCETTHLCPYSLDIGSDMLNTNEGHIYPVCLSVTLGHSYSGMHWAV